MIKKISLDMEEDKYFKAFSDRLTEVFGKNTFSADELTKEFYIELKISCSEFFEHEDGVFAADHFWSDGLREYLLSEKDQTGACLC